MRLFIASIFTLFLLSGMLFSILLTISFLYGFINVYTLILLTILLNFFIWLFNPYIGDIVNKIFYRVRFIEIDGIRKIDKELARFIEDVCKKVNIKIPKIGYIEDDNPQAFTYGSASFNARIVVTAGIFRYLNTKERQAVLAHEIGHIKNRDFIIMSIASTIVQLLYEIYWIMRVSLRSENKNRSDVPKIVIAALSYIFFIVGTYILLYLSRIREYCADRFSAKITGDPNLLCSALIKIAYGILANPDTEREIRLMKSTRTIGIFDYKQAKNIALMGNSKKFELNKMDVSRVLLFDVLNPWAFILELNSTHPLTGKRIIALNRLCKEIGIKPVFNLDKEIKISKVKLYKNFLIDVLILFMPIILFSVPLIFFAYNFLTTNSTFLLFPSLSISLILYGIASIFKTFYRYTNKDLKRVTIFNLMNNVYASPIKGIRVRLKGVVIGRGIPGLIFSEDMMFQDRTGLIYLNYESIIPFFGNLLFAFSKLNKLVGKECEIEGWFLRGITGRIELSYIKVDKKKYKSWVKELNIIFSLIAVIIGILFFSFIII